MPCDEVQSVQWMTGTLQMIEWRSKVLLGTCVLVLWTCVLVLVSCYRHTLTTHALTLVYVPIYLAGPNHSCLIQHAILHCIS